MAENPKPNQQNRSVLFGRSGSDTETKTSLLLTFGLAATITGIFSAGGDFLEGRQKTDEQRCSIAQQFVLDEMPSPALSAAQRTRLDVLAVRRMELCMGETR